MNPTIKQAVSEALTKRSQFEQSLIIKAWEDETFRQELLSNPKAVYARETGQEIPADLQIEVIEEPANTVKLVLPQKPVLPEVEEELSEAELEAIVGGKPSVETAVTIRGV